MDMEQPQAAAQRINACWIAGQGFLRLSLQCARLDLPGLSWWFRTWADGEIRAALGQYDEWLAAGREACPEGCWDPRRPDPVLPYARLLRTWTMLGVSPPGRPE